MKLSHLTEKIKARKFIRIFISSILMVSCSTLKNSHKYELDDDYYEFRQKGSRYQKAFAYIEDDTIRIFRQKNVKEPILSVPGKDQLFLKRSFDVDVMTVGFKYRPGTLNLPRQLNTDFNGNVFIGYRLDRFRVRYDKTPFRTRKIFHHRGLTAGGFTGLGATSITPWTTNNLSTDEYNGFILSRGLAAMVGLNNLTVGFGIGWDYLTDRDKDIWIYQNKPWYGLTVGLNLN